MVMHTPGPWEAEGCVISGPEYEIATSESGREFPQNMDHDAMRAENDRDWAEAAANARLIAAAPDLLDALSHLQAWATDCFGPEGTVIPDNHPIMIARAAIAKATQC